MLTEHQSPRINARAHGVVGDGSDVTTKLTSLLTLASNLGGATIDLPGGTIGISDPISVPTAVNIVGASGNSRGSKPGTTIKALSADACLNFGERTTGSFGSLSGGFVLDGNDTSPQMLYLGRTLERTFQNISIINCAAGGSAMLVEEAQNNQFVGLLLDSNAGNGITFDRGCAGNRFFGVESTEQGVSGGYHVVFTATSTSVSNLLSYPSNNHIFGSIFERDGGACDGIIYHGAGSDNSFWGTNIAGATPTRAFPLVKIEIGNAAITTQSVRLTFWGCTFTGSQTYNTVFDMDDATSILLCGNPLIQGALNLYEFRSTSPVSRLIGYPVRSNITNVVSGTSVGTIAQELVMFPKALIHGYIDSTSAFTVEKTDGTDVFNVNASAPSVTLPNGSSLIIYSDNYSTEKVRLSASTGRITSQEKVLAASGIGVGNSAAATTLGTVTKKIQVFDASGNSLGYVPVYDAIT